MQETLYTFSVKIKLILYYNRFYVVRFCNSFCCICSLNFDSCIRTLVVVLMAWLMVFITNAQGGLSSISKKSWLFLILSGLATGASWLCYYKALQMGEASKVVPIDKLSVVITLILAFVFLHEQFTIKSIIGCILIGAGTLLMVL